MKKNDFEGLNLDSKQLLNSEQMKQIVGGYTSCKDGEPCAADEICCIAAGYECRLILDGTSPCFGQGGN